MNQSLKNILSLCRRGAISALMLLMLTSTLCVAAVKSPVFDFSCSDIEISRALDSLATLGRANIVVSPDVKGTITLKLSGVTFDTALQTITSMSGCSYVEKDGVYLVSKTGAVAPKSGNAGYFLYELKVISSSDAIGALGVAFADMQVKAPLAQKLIVSGDRNRLISAKAFLDQIDEVPPQTVQTEQLYRIKSLVPRQAKQYIDELYRGQGLSITFAPNHRSVAALAVPVSADAAAKTDASQSWESDTLILRGTAGIVAKAIASLDKIDIARPQSEERVRVKSIFATQAISYLLGQYESKGLAVITAPMTNIYNEKGPVTTAGAVGTRVTSDKDGKLNVSEPIGDFILKGDTEVVEEAKAALAKIDIGPERILKKVTLRFLSAADAQEKLAEIFGSRGLLVTAGPGDADFKVILADASGIKGEADAAEKKITDLKVRDIILRGPSDVVQEAEALLNDIDVETPLINIATKFISMSKEDSKTLGIEWQKAANGAISVDFNELSSGDPLAFGRIIRDPIHLNALINLLQTKTSAKIMNQPSTSVQNGREASINVVKKILVQTVKTISINGTPSFEILEFNVGVTLQVMPIMERDGVITLAITVVDSSVTAMRQGPSGAALPEISEAKTVTTVRLRDGESLVIGGLKQNSMSVVDTKVPILGDIPIIGRALFNSKKTVPASSDLTIIVTPRVEKPLPAAPAV